MKIAHILWGLKTGGIETMLVDLVNIQVKNAEIAIIVINDIVNPEIINKIDKRCKLFFCNRPIGSKNPYYIVKLNYIIYKFAPNIIHFHYTGIINHIYYKKSKKVITIHNTHSSSDDYKAYDRLFSISNAVKEYTLRQNYESTVISNGIPTSNIMPKNDILDNYSKKIVQIGRLSHLHKGQHITLYALKYLLEKYPKFNVTLDFIGEGESYIFLKNIVEKLNLQNHVKFIGNKSRDYIYANLKNYDLLIQPSINEGFGLTVIEAITAKVPVIVSDIPSLREVTCNGKFASIFPVEDAHSLAKVLHNCLSYKNLKKLDDSRNFIIKNYDIKITAQKYYTEYKKIL